MTQKTKTEPLRQECILENKEYRQYIYLEDGIVVDKKYFRLENGLEIPTEEPKEGEYVEISPLYFLTERESYFTEETDANGFMYSTGNRGQLSGWAIGYPCFYNHSETPNIDPLDEIRFHGWRTLSC